MEKKTNPGISRRQFLKTIGTGAALTTAALHGCKPGTTAQAEDSENTQVPKDRMTYRTTPTTGDKVSLLGYGCMRWPLRKNADGQDEIDQDTVNELVDYAIEHGVNYFDTAPVYIRGWSETATGIALKRHPRNTFYIATKLSTGRNDPYTRSFAAARTMYENSLKNLQVDSIDYYLIHSVGGGEDAVRDIDNRLHDNGVLDFLLAERKAGRIRNLGWSFHGDVKGFDYMLSLHEKAQWDFVQIQLNYIDWQHATGRNINAEYLLAELEKKNIPAVIMEPLLGGRLARVNAQALNIMKQIHPAHTPAQWALRYAGTPQSVLTVLSGMVYMEHLQENIRTYAPLQPLNEQEYQALEKVTQIMLNSDYIQCTTCQYCMPCPYGLDIPAIFAHYNRCVSAGQRLNTSADPNYKEARRAFLIGYDRAVPPLRQANHCTEC
ncbi:MAG: aldo/keto reductase, partial [Mediterranea sp.]|nr:aldo/keto reductase [Mediterranea sp.]